MRGYKSKNQLLIAFLVVGFLIGVIYENLVTKNMIITIEIFTKSNLQRFLQTDVIAEKYLWYVLRERAFFLLLVCVLSFVKWKKIYVALCLGITGFFLGMLCVAAVIQLGIKGILLCILGMFPQVLFYGFVYGMLFMHWFQFPDRKWNRIKTSFVAILFALGIILEIYVNPIIVKFIIRIL